MLLKILDDSDNIVSSFEMDYFYKIGNVIYGKCYKTDLKILLEKHSIYLNDSSVVSVIFKTLIFEKNGNEIVKF